MANPLAQVATKGHIDSATYDAALGELSIAGWTWSDQAQSPATDLSITIHGKTENIHIAEEILRDDVKTALGLTVARVGFHTKIPIPISLIRNSDTFQIAASFGNRESLILAGKIEILSTTQEKRFNRRMILFGLIVATIILTRLGSLKFGGNTSGRWIQSHPQYITLIISGAFLILVFLGITGSSGQLLFEDPHGVFARSVFETPEARGRLFRLRDVRSDEWGVLAPNTLAQLNHVPPFPIINSNIGPDGQNMGVIGMTGVPIAQLSALARPATWGYFFLPLDQALAWQWQFPFFACLLLLWQALNLLRPANSTFNLALSGLFCTAPYAAGWSLWPLYAAFFPLALFVSVAALFRVRSSVRAVFLGCAIGLLLAGWVLVLYPPWQITVGTFLVVLGIGWMRDFRHEIILTRVQWAGIFAALGIAILLLASWWLDTYEAIELIQRTVYPGSRNTLTGGDMHPLWALRGYTNPEALTYGTGKDTNSSEIGSYILFPVAILVLAISECWRGRSTDWTLRACFIFILFCLIFWFFGIPGFLARWTLWSLVPSSRVDLALGLAFIVLMALSYRRGDDKVDSTSEGGFAWVALCVASIGAALAFLDLYLTPSSYSRTNDVLFAGAIALAVFCGSWWTMRGQMVSAVAMLFLLNGVSTIGFNPLSHAPNTLKISAATTMLASASKNSSTPERTLVIGGGGFAPMALSAAGIPTVNGIFYYPQASFWRSIGISKKDWPLVNRYQHLGFEIGHLPAGAAYKIENPKLDVVNVTIDPSTFNFAGTGARRVAAVANDAAALRESPQLQELGQNKGVFWFAVAAH